jgi:ubiquitin carboxyl-terminal hydrolase 8
MGSWGDPRQTNPVGAVPRNYPHFKDIMKDTVPQVSKDAPLNEQLRNAEDYINASRRSLEFKRPDLAYKDFVKGFEIAINYIPRHKDYGFFTDNDRKWYPRYRNLCQTIRNLEGKMEELRQLIKEDNERTGTLPRDESNQQTSTPVYSSGFGLHNENHASISNQTNGRPSSSQFDKMRPPVRPKPQNLHGGPATGTDTELSQRFARLRMPSNGSGDPPRLSMPDPANYGGGAKERPQSYSHSSITSSNGYSSRPIGPRDMPAFSNGPSLPPKLPLITANFSLPKPPDSVYSPDKVSTAPLSRNISRSSMEVNGAERRPNYYNQPNGAPLPPQIQRARDENPYRPRTPNGIHPAIVAKSRSSEIPHDPIVDVNTLASYMRKYNVLLVDVRERSIFDEGHVLASSIICIEPLSLRSGMSAEELEERLVISPDHELSLFERRDEFDLVVYYDQNTTNVRFLSGPPSGPLRALYDTLYEFNTYKTLKDGRPPAMLHGGVDAWVDYMGAHSLATSKTAAMLGSTARRAGVHATRPLARQRMASLNSTLEVRRRRLNKYTPLDEAEEQAWRQKAKEDEVATNDYPRDGSDEDEEIEPNSPFVHDVESFLRNFPDIAMQESMTMPRRRPPVPPVPRYEEASLPSIPSRPPPAIPRPSYGGQADIQASQPALARVTSASRPPLYSDSYPSRQKKLPRTGLTNFGVTCYMNATLQCLSATMPLSNFFQDDRYKHAIQKNWKGTGGFMPDIYATVVRELWRGDVTAIKPTTFRKFCGRMNSEWGIDRQQDAKEFFDFLVDSLHEDLNMRWMRNPPRPLTTAEELRREQIPIGEASRYEWERFIHRDFSYVSSLFAGQHASRLRCTTCRMTSTTYEAFYSISVEIPQSGRGDIYSCLRSYTQEERLSGDEKWQCPHCKCEREATKQIILTRLPQILVIHFKRFRASKTESARKIHTPIDFPLYGFNMDPFVAQRPQPVVSDDSKVDPAITPPFSYEAYGVLRHLGNTGNGGHYISMVRDPGRGCWRKFDDQNYYDFEPSKLKERDALTNGEAYIVFYERARSR